jgi:Ca-activated chloride channel family protein
VYTSGQVNGTATFAAPATGSYVARAFSNGTFTRLAESAAFSTAGASVTTDQSSYAVGTTVTASYSAPPGNARDWIALAPAGSANTSYVAYTYANGHASGTATFTAPTAGTYVVRVFSNNTFTRLAESAAFTTAGAAVSTNKAAYATGATLTVSYSGMPGNVHDWITIAPAGSANTSYVAYVYTNGRVSGTATFTAPAAGTYVARAFTNNTFTRLAESAALKVFGVSTNQTSYVMGGTVTVSYSGMPGNAHDWIAIAPAGAASTSYVAWVYTNGQLSGTATFAAPSPGTYVVRLFPNNTFTPLTESATFATLSPSITANQASYVVGTTVTVSYAGLSGNAHDWIAIAAAGSPSTSYVAFAYTGGRTSGTATFTAPAAGSYVARALPSGTFNVLLQSATFATVASSVSTDLSSYAAGATVTVSYSGLPGNAKDWIAIAPEGSANTTYLSYVYTNGQTSGTATFTAPAAGSFVVRTFADNGFSLLSQSEAFTTQ